MKHSTVTGQTSKMELLAKIVSGFKPLNVFAKFPILAV